MDKLSPEDAMLLRWCNGNTDAASLLYGLGKLSQVADDLADCDLKVSPDVAVVELLLGTLVHIPNNPFFQRNMQWYLPVFFTSLMSWELSNKLEKSSERKSRMFAYVLRESLDQVISVTALLTGGADHARRVVEEVHIFYHLQDNPETFEQWENEHRQPGTDTANCHKQH